MSGLAITPGPWVVHATARLIVPAADALKEVTRKGNREVDFEPAGAPNSIALLRDCDEKMTEDESLANGFLIAAAPDLYDALEAVLSSCDRGPPAGHDGFGTRVISAPHPDAMCKAQSALAKARGKL